MKIIFLRRYTIEFMGLWESLNNEGFNVTEFGNIIHTDAVKENLIPQEVSKFQVQFIYASEADVLNVALFGKTAKEWRESNRDKTGNLRDEASLEQLVVLSNLESINSVLIRQDISQSERLVRLNEIAITQMRSLISNRSMKKLIK